jgi:hypothetical protein
MIYSGDMAVAKDHLDDFHFALQIATTREEAERAIRRFTRSDAGRQLSLDRLRRVNAIARRWYVKRLPR